MGSLDWLKVCKRVSLGDGNLLLLLILFFSRSRFLLSKGSFFSLFSPLLFLFLFNLFAASPCPAQNKGKREKEGAELRAARLPIPGSGREREQPRGRAGSLRRTTR